MTTRVLVHQARIDHLLHNPNGTIGTVLLRTGRLVETRSKLLCPVDKGRLRSSISISKVFNRAASLVIRIGTNVRYARWVHEGTWKMRGRPFLREALRQQMR